METSFDVSDQDLREMENPEVACAVDALMDFMECFPETWGQKVKGSTSKLPIQRHCDSDWLAEYLKSFLSVPYFVEAPEIRAWLLKVGILVAARGNAQAATRFDADALNSYNVDNLNKDLDALRKGTQDEVLARVKEERPEVLSQVEELMRREEHQFQKTQQLRELVFKRIVLWLKKNKKSLVETSGLLVQLPEILSATCACYIDIEHHQLLEELQHRQYLEIAPLEEGEAETGKKDEIVWHLDHLELKPRRQSKKSVFSCSQLIVLLSCAAVAVAGLLRLFEVLGVLPDTRPPERT